MQDGASGVIDQQVMLRGPGAARALKLILDLRISFHQSNPCSS
jgi:hypothetical protein